MAKSRDGAEYASICDHLASVAASVALGWPRGALSLPLGGRQIMHRSRTRRLAFVLMAITLAALGGCVGGIALTGDPAGPGVSSGSTAFSPVTDIPIPYGATLANQKSLIKKRNNP